MFFLTELDPRAKIKGSRDPLGLQPIWTRFGRAVVGNLTTVTNSLRSFTTLLLGLHFADESIARGKADEEDRVDLFLKFEQLAAYSRYAHNDVDPERGRILGITRVKRRADEADRVRISANRSDQILSNQKTYGIWGLFTVAARQSGLCVQGDHRPTPEARAFVQAEYLPQFPIKNGVRGADVYAFLEGERSFEPHGKDQPLAQTLAKILDPEVTPEEEALYGRSLVLGVGPAGNGQRARHDDPTHGRQHDLWTTLSELNDDGPFGWPTEFGYPELVEATKRARTSGRDDLAECLDRIEALEPFLAASAGAFGFLLNRNRQRIGSVADEVERAWGDGLRHLRVDRLTELRQQIVEASSEEAADRLLDMARALRGGDYVAFMELALDHNAAVMRARGGAPWLTLSRNRLDVRVKEEQAALPDTEELRQPWSNSYFINSLKAVGATVYGTGERE